jgi:tRNA threonylcarbamoyladenosine biosynthesis protein TsaE
MKTYRTLSSEETKSLGADVAKVLDKAFSPRATGATVVALYGDLGTGKTTFTQGFLRAIGARGRITSPTFVLMKKFRLPSKGKPGFERAYHIDAYRLKSKQDATTLGLKDILDDPLAIVLVEWPERIKGALPRRKTTIRFAHGKDRNERVIKVS